MKKSSPESIAAIGDDLLYADLCNTFNVTRGERELPDLVRAMAAHIIDSARSAPLPKESSGGKPRKWTPEAQAALIVDVRRELGDGEALGEAMDRIVAIQPWQRLMSGCSEGSAPEALTRAFNRARKNEEALVLVEEFDRYRSKLGSEIWRVRVDRVIERSVEADRQVRGKLKGLACPKCGARTTNKERR